VDFLAADLWAECPLLRAQSNGESHPTPTALPSEGKPFTIDAMRAATAAIRAGRFDVPPTRTRALTPPARPALSSGWHDDVDGSAVVVVIGGHAGAGASTVALALSEGLTDRASVHLCDWHLPRHSGIDVAVTQELGTEFGWRQGRRGPLLISRQVEPDAGCPPVATNGRSPRVCVIDLGHLVDDDLRALSSATAAVVVVTRVSLPGVRQTEHVLSFLTEEALVVGIGPRCWPGRVEVSCGPRLRELKERHRVVAMPLDRGLAVTGLTTDPLPRHVAAAGRRIVALLQPAPVVARPRPAGALTARADAS
jgi:hypothetical protein